MNLAEPAPSPAALLQTTASVRSNLELYFQRLAAGEPAAGRPERIAWRLSCFDDGLSYGEYLQQHSRTLAGCHALDAACAWGGHAVAMAALGAHVVAADLNPHALASLQHFGSENGLSLVTCQASCEDFPFRDQAFDVILALELVEHIASVERFSTEVARLLRPGGVCLLSTPARLRSFLWGEPHYGLRGLTLLPLPLQRMVATRLLGRSYPYPIPRQYSTASSVLRPFLARGLSGFPVIRGRLDYYCRGRSTAYRLAREFLWNFLIVQKP